MNQRNNKKKSIKTSCAIIISIAILTFLYSRVDYIQLKIAFSESNILLLILGIVISIFLGILGGLRYTYFLNILKIKPYPGFYTSTKSYFICSTLNLFLPSKLGDLGRGYICSKIDRFKYPKLINIYTIYEKISDLLAILLIGTLLFLLITINSSAIQYFASLDTISYRLIEQIGVIIITSSIFLILILYPFTKYYFLEKNFTFLSSKLIAIIDFKSIFTLRKFLHYHFISIIVWIIHLLQICIFAKGLEMNLWNINGLFVIIITILIGLMPISFAGIGTRDASLVLFLSPYYGESKALLLGVLLTSRYVIPALVGLSLIGKGFINKTRSAIPY